MVRDARYLGMASRMCAEMGATFVKTYYCENFEEVVNICPCPIVIAGGNGDLNYKLAPKKTPEKEALQMAKSAIEKGAVGVDYN